MEPNLLFVKSMRKGLAILDAFNTGERYLSLSEIAARSGLDKSAAQRFVFTLEQLGYLDRCPRTRRLSLGKKVLDLTFSFLRSHPLVDAATPVLIELRRACGERVSLSLFDNTTLIYAVRQSGKRETFYSSLIGRRMPIHCAAGGRAIMAHLSEDEAAELIARSNLKPQTPTTVTDPARILEKVAQARAQGYAVVVGESVVGEITVAAAVLDNESRPIAAVHIAGSLGEWEPAEYERRFAPLAVEAAWSLSQIDAMSPAAIRSAS